VAPAVFVGELLDLALATLRDGAPFESGEDLAAAVATLAVASVAPAVAYGWGERAFERAQAQAVIDAAARKAEYEAFVARATDPSAEPTPTAPPPRKD
jgi:K+-transporting ATPase A subunit